MSKDAPFAVELPEASRDRPGWIKVGVIAAVGFVLGIAWPRVMGVRLGIAAPGESTSASASASAHGGRAPEPPPASVVTKGPAALGSEIAAQPTVAVPASTTPPGGAPNISIQKGSVLSCKTADGDAKKGKECGSITAIDQFVGPRVRKLSTCAGVEGQTGKLSLVVGADFAANKFTYDVGKSSTIPNPDAIATCLKTTFRGTTMSAAAHEHPRYTIAYSAVFSPGTPAVAGGEPTPARADKAEAEGIKDKAERSAKEPPSDKAEEKAERADLASGEAKVAWEVALVREAPKSGGLVTRLPRGTKVKVGSTKDGWYQIKFGEGFANDGWVYRGAIGR